jgi:hypothetical protein
MGGSDLWRCVFIASPRAAAFSLLLALSRRVRIDKIREKRRGGEGGERRSPAIEYDTDYSVWVYLLLE